MIANLTHHDLDGIVCHILLKNITDQVRYYCCGYGKIEKKINEIIRDNEIYRFKNVCVTDLSISIEHSQKLHSHFSKMFLFDHHETTKLQYEELKKHYTKIYHDMLHCGSSIIFNNFRNRFSNERLEKLVYLTNIYDTWQIDDKDFWEAYALNAMFWEYKWDDFFIKYFDGYIPISPTEMKWVEDGFEKKKQIIDACEQYIFNDNCILLMAKNANEITNEVTLVKKDFKYYFIFTPNENKISIRIRNDGANLSKVFEQIKTLPIIVDCGAHPYAGGITLKPGYAQEEFENLINLICEKLEEVKNAQN